MEFFAAFLPRTKTLLLFSFALKRNAGNAINDLGEPSHFDMFDRLTFLKKTCLPSKMQFFLCSVLTEKNNTFKRDRVTNNCRINCNYGYKKDGQ